MNPEQLGRLTIKEYLELLKGYAWREKRELERMAQLASWVTAPHVKKPIDPKKFLQLKDEKKKQKTTTPEESETIVNELMQEMGVEGGI